MNLTLIWMLNMAYSGFFLDKLHDDEEEIDSKILCILEGNDELEFVKKTYSLFFDKAISHEGFVDDVIELSWGKNPIKWTSAIGFQGGSLPGARAPLPVLEALESKNLNAYKAILVMFDADLDDNAYVYGEAGSKLNEAGAAHYIFYSEPCVEAELLKLIVNSDGQDLIIKQQTEVSGANCFWYKSSWQSLPKKTKFSSTQSPSSLLKRLNKEDYIDTHQKIKKLSCFVMENFI